MTLPTVGRTVHYVSAGSKDGRYPSTCRAAIVTEVSEKRADPTDVGLMVINPTGVHFDRQVRHDEDQDPMTWHWPCVITPEEKV